MRIESFARNEVVRARARVLRALLGVAAIAWLPLPLRAEGVKEDSRAMRPWTLLGDVRLRTDIVDGLPEGRELKRGRSFLRLGLAWTPALQLEVGVAGKTALGTDSNRDNRRNNDNEASDGSRLDQAYVRWFPAPTSVLCAGKTELPLWLTPLVWDHDLRPVGISYSQRIPVRVFDALRFSGGYFAGDHLYGDESRLGAAQVGWLWRNGAVRGGDVLVGFLHFENLDRLAREGLRRTNDGSTGAIASRFQLLDVQVAGRFAWRKVPGVARLDFVHNFGARESSGLDNGFRFNLVSGKVEGAGTGEVGYALQRIQQDAVLAAFNSDDWWFHSRSSGQTVWVEIGLAPGVSLRTQAFFERREGLERWSTRILTDLAWRF